MTNPPQNCYYAAPIIENNLTVNERLQIMLDDPDNYKDDENYVPPTLEDIFGTPDDDDD